MHAGHSGNGTYNRQRPFSSLSKGVVGEVGSCNCCMCKEAKNGSFYRCIIIDDPTNTVSVNYLIN